MTKLLCPECGSEMTWSGYRPLFPKCPECDQAFHVDRCERAE